MMTEVTLSVILPTVGRDTLIHAVASVASQLEHGDELIVKRLDCHWGDEARDEAIQQANGSHLLFMDDDDAYVDGALDTIRQAVRADPDRVHIFRMRYPDGSLIWRERDNVRCGNVSSIILCVPRHPVAGWGEAYEGDHHFLVGTLQLRGDQPVFHDDVVALVRPHEAAMVAA